MNGKDKLGLLDISAIIAGITALVGDIFSLFAIGGIIPIIGLPILFFALSVHYLAGLMVGAFAFNKLVGWIPKTVLTIGIILPLPTLLLSLFLAIILQSEIVQTVAIAAVGAVTGGAGAVAAKGISAAAEVAGEAEGAAIGVEGVGAARAVTGIERGAAAEEEAAEMPKPASTRREISPEELGEQPEAMEELQRRLLEETPSGANEEDEEEDEEGVYVDGDEIDLRKAA